MPWVSGIPGKWGVVLVALVLVGASYCADQHNKRLSADLQRPSELTRALTQAMPPWFHAISRLECQERISTAALICRIGGQSESALTFWQGEFRKQGWGVVQEQFQTRVLRQGDVEVRMTYAQRSRELVFEVSSLSEGKAALPSLLQGLATSA